MFFVLFFEILKLYTTTRALKVILLGIQNGLCIVSGIIEDEMEGSGLFLILLI